MNRFMLTGALATLLPLCGAGACSDAARPLAASNPSTEQVTAEFYGHYAELVRRQDEWRRKPKAEREPKDLKSPDLQILEDYPAYLHPSLRQGLSDNHKAELATGGIAALDADPFFCTQETLQSYSILGVRHDGARDVVELEVRVAEPGSDLKQAVSVELSDLGGKKVITDIHCAQDERSLMQRLDYFLKDSQR
jgi:hypothetical protein